MGPADVIACHIIDTAGTWPGRHYCVSHHRTPLTQVTRVQEPLDDVTGNIWQALSVGFAAAKQLAAQGKRVVLACRSEVGVHLHEQPRRWRYVA
jgi:hypothetical protein